MPSLKHAYLRLARANEHLTELQSLAHAACDAYCKAMVIESREDSVLIAPGDMAPVGVFDARNAPPVPDRCSILVGDAIYSLRCALDYLVAELIELDSGIRQERTQFPIESTPEGFKGRQSKGSFLFGLNDQHIAVIERLQPYSGCDWTGRLRDMSNIDKHNNLVFCRYRGSMTGAANLIPSTDVSPIQLSVDMEIHVALSVQLDETLPLAETLKIIKTQVSQTLDAFNPEFQ